MITFPSSRHFGLADIHWEREGRGVGECDSGQKGEASSTITPTGHDTPFHGLFVRYIIERLDQNIAKIYFTHFKSDCTCGVRN
jgi:hypothetical protein